MPREFIEKLRAERDAYKPEDNQSMCLRWQSDRDVQYMTQCTMATVCCARDSGRFDAIAAYMLVGFCVQTACVPVHCVPDSAWRMKQGCGLFCDVARDGCHIEDSKKSRLCCAGICCCCDQRADAILENYQRSSFAELLTDNSYDEFKSGPLAQQMH